MLGAIILFIALALVFGLSYYFNAKTPVPKGCENLKHDCSGCQITTCANRHPKEGEK
ncbi:MAG: hypothetical protein PUD22_09390 [Erysipelotrichaceae bacterium]|nr:hypothetical protein [Erysipelotrichaceae bacterium]